MIPLKILCLILLAWPALSSPLKAPAPKQRLPVYFPITPEEFEAYGIRLSPSASRGSSKSVRGGTVDLPSTTPKPTTTTMRLPIAQESHVAPSEILLEVPGASYLTDSTYYIPGRPTQQSSNGVEHQDISGNPRYEDDDRGNSFIEPSYSSRSRSRGNQRNEEDEEDTPRYSVVGPDTSPQDQDRFGIFFIGEHESFGGSEEHFQEVPFGSLYIPPNSEEDIVPSLQTLPAARPSSLNYGSRVSVEVSDEPVYGPPRRPSSRYESPDQSFEDEYLPPTTTTTQAPSTTERSYEPPSTTERSYLPPSSTVSYYTPPSTPARYYVPSTTERSYLPPSTTEGRYQAPTKESSEEVPESVTTPRYSRPRISQSTGYGPSVTTERVYVQSRATSSPRRYTPPTTTTAKPYSPPRRYSPKTTATTEKPYSPPRRYNPPTTTTDRAYTSAPRTSAPRRYTIPTTTTEKTYGVPKLVSVRRYTGSPPTTTERSYTEKPASRGRSRARARYTPPSTTTVAPATTAAPVRYRRPTTTEASSHAVYVKASSDEGKSRKASSPRQRTSYKSRGKESSRKSYSRQPTVIKSVYSAPSNLTIKSISVASSSSVSSSAPANSYTGARSRPSRLRSSSRASSTYKSPFSSEEKEGKVLTASGSRSSDSRAGSKYQFPVYTTSDKSFQAPSSLYQIRDSSKTTAVSTYQPDFVQAGNNIYIPQEYDESSIPGEAGVDYPVLRDVPETSFRCEAQEHPGLYADTEADCQVFHICQKAGRHDSFLCPNGTVFNQQYFVCDWWYNFACDSATSFFGLNEFIYELPDEDDYKKSK